MQAKITKTEAKKERRKQRKAANEKPEGDAEDEGSQNPKEALSKASAEGQLQTSAANNTAAANDEAKKKQADLEAEQVAASELHGAWCMLHAAGSVLHVVCCGLGVPGCGLHVVCRMLHVPRRHVACCVSPFAFRMSHVVCRHVAC